MIAAPRFENARQRFEDLLNQTLRLISERCSPEFPSSIFYAYKQQEEERDKPNLNGVGYYANRADESRISINRYLANAY